MRPQGSPPKPEPPLRDVRFIPAWRYMKAAIRRWLERNGILPSRPGRQDVWRAQDRGELVNPQVQVQQDDAGTIVIRARPKAKMTFRVYRAATGQWGNPIEVDGVKVETQEE